MAATDLVDDNTRTAKSPFDQDDAKFMMTTKRHCINYNNQENIALE